MSNGNLNLFVMLSIAGPASLPLFGQTKVEELMKIKPSYIEKFDYKPKEKVIALEMDFNSPEFQNPAMTSLLEGKSVIKVELYYTHFQMAQTFDQPSLNRERYIELKRLCPYIFKQSFVQWEIVGQTACHTVGDAKNYFHGFVITFIPTPDKALLLAEKKSILNILSSDSLGRDSVYETTEIKKKRATVYTGYYIPTSKRKRALGIRYTKKSIWNRKREYYTRIDTTMYKRKYKAFIPSEKAVTFIKKLPDSTIFNVLARQKNWNNILFVCDATGSMAPYTTEIMVWHKLNYKTRKAKYFTFFNDGDNMADNRKVIGKTGGVYTTGADNYESVEKMLYSVMERGNGGDAPENNCEAILKSLQTVPDAQEIVMIADNWANVKDLALADKIKKPVHIILCGADNGLINVDYLELARRTKGSIHTMKEDLDNLSKMSEGQSFFLGKNKFKVSGGKVIACK